jgi:O-antigen/teichoic acid export membrane protein
MSALRQLASQTAIYGLSSIIGRFLNYLLVPLHTSAAVFSTRQYGIITEMYAYVAFLVILLTYGMETSFFRFYNKAGFDKNKVYATSLTTLLCSSSIFILISILFAEPLANWLRYPNHAEYVIWFAIIVGLDAWSSIPLAKLRAENKAIKFALINLSNVGINILLNLFFLAYCMPLYKSGQTNLLIETFYNPEIGVGYVFIANLIASIFKFLLLSPQLLQIKEGVNIDILKQMLIYGIPLLFAGLAGIVNETIDRLMLKQMLFDLRGEKTTMSLIGIYGGVYKISIIITLFIQAFRYAAEPFFFAKEKEADAKFTYAKVMNYFVIVCSVIFLAVMLFIDIIKYFTPNADYWQALHIVPVLLFANIFLGIYYNQSVWYKLSGKTMYGAWLQFLGAIITLVINYLFIPKYDYTAAAWATFICYACMMIASYVLGQKHYPIPYSVIRIMLYLLSACMLYYLSLQITINHLALSYILKAIILIFYIFTLLYIEHYCNKKNTCSPPL